MKKSHLTLEQRYQIQAYNEAGKKLTEIADLILKDKSVVCREMQRNKNEKGRYKAAYASGLSRDKERASKAATEAISRNGKGYQEGPYRRPMVT